MDKPRLRVFSRLFPVGFAVILCGTAFAFSPACAEYADENFSQTRKNPVLGVRADSFKNVILQLVELKHRLVNGEEIELPMVSVTIAGRTFSGRILDCQTAESNPVLLMETREGEGRFNCERLTYLRVSEITALEIHDTWSKQVQATLGIAPREALPAPTKIDLKRKMANFSTWVSETSGHAITYTMDLAALQANDDLLRAISSAMNETTSGVSELMRQFPAVAKDLKSVVFAVGKESAAKFAGGTLYVTINGSTPQSYKRGALSQQIKQATQKN